ncbi:MAG: hypothetical protein AAB544_01525 [Patescibacteria group bacterium]
MPHHPFEIIDQHTIGNNVFTLRGIAGVADDRGSSQTFLYLEVLCGDTRLHASQLITHAKDEEAARIFQQGIDEGRKRLKKSISQSQHAREAVGEMHGLPLLIGLATFGGREQVRTLMGLSPIHNPEEADETTAASSA